MVTALARQSQRVAVVVAALLAWEPEPARTVLRAPMATKFSRAPEVEVEVEDAEALAPQAAKVAKVASALAVAVVAGQTPRLRQAQVPLRPEPAATAAPDV